MAGVVVVGSGFVGRSVASSLRASGEVEVTTIGVSTHPELADRGDAGRSTVLATLERTGATALVNTAGLLRGTDAEMTAANVEWPAWLASTVLPGSGVRLVHLGSAAEYGDPGSDEPIPETADPNPSGTYGETKWAGSAAVLDARRAGLDAVVARGFNLVGPNLSPVSPLHQFITDVTALPPDGGVVDVWYPATTRDFILTEDLATALAHLALLDAVPDIVNLCSKARIRFDEIVAAIAQRQGKRVEIRSLDRPGIPVVVGDNERLRRLCSMAPAMTPELIASRASI